MKAEGKRQKAEGRAATIGLMYVFCLLPFAFCLSSCSSLPELPWAPVARDASAGFYDTARLEYSLDAGKLGQPLDVVRVDGRQVRYEKVASSPLADQSIGRLVIQYPHPAGRPGMSRVTYSLDSSRADAAAAGGWNPFDSGRPAAGITPGHEEIHEVWALDIPSAESDRYFKLLSTQNFYQAPANETGSAALAVTINGKTIRKNWEQMAELNALAQRVRRDGQLAALLRPAALGGTSASPIVSAQNFREMLAAAGHTTDRTSSGPSGSAGAPSPGQDSPSMARLPYAAK